MQTSSQLLVLDELHSLTSENEEVHHIRSRMILLLATSTAGRHEIDEYRVAVSSRKTVSLYVRFRTHEER